MRLAKALAEVRGTPVQDQVVEARRAWGILAEGLSEAEARSMARELRGAGVPCAVGPGAAMAELPPVEVAASLEEIPSSDPTLVAAAAIEVATTSTEETGPTSAQKAASAAIMLTTGLPIKVGGRKRKVETTRHEGTLLFHLDLHFPELERRLRVDAAHFDFSCLGDRMLYQSQGNLRLLVADRVEAAPEAWVNHGTRVLLEGRPIRTMGYRSLDDLDREARWLLTLARSGL